LPCPLSLGILETALYVDAFERACPFYEQVLGLNGIYRDARLCAYDAGGRGVLLLFLRGHSLATVHLPGGTIPPHDGHDGHLLDWQLAGSFYNIYGIIYL